MKLEFVFILVAGLVRLAVQNVLEMDGAFRATKSGKLHIVYHYLSLSSLKIIFTYEAGIL